MEAPKRIILEDTGERRYPKANEIYVLIHPYVDPNCERYPTLEESIFVADYYDGEWGGEPQDFAIYKIVEAR